MVGIGLISYPLYLWHWPILSYLYIVIGEMPSIRVRFLAIGASFILAIITYRLVEIPIRYGRYIKTKTGILLLFMGILATFGLATFNQNGFKARTAAELRNIRPGDIGHDDFHRYTKDNFYPCKPDHIYKNSLSWKNFVRCQQSRPSSTIDMAIIGDSHAEHLFIGLAESLPSKNIVYYLKPGYPFIKNKEYSEIFDYVLKSQSIKIVILTMAWGRINDLSPEEIRQQILDTAQIFINSGKEVYLTNDVPGGVEAIRCKGIRWITKGLLIPQPCTLSDIPRNAKDFSESFPLAIMLNAINQNSAIKLLETYKYFCNSNECTMLDENGNILYRDTNHLNIIGSRFVGNQLLNDYPELKK